MSYLHFLRHFHGERYIQTMPARRIFKTLSYLKRKIDNILLEEFIVLTMLSRNDFFGKTVTYTHNKC